MRARIVVLLLLGGVLYGFWHLAVRSEGFRDLLARHLEGELGLPVTLGRCRAAVDLHVEAEEVKVGEARGPAACRLEAERLAYLWRPPWRVRVLPGPRRQIVLDGVRLHLPAEFREAGELGFVPAILNVLFKGPNSVDEQEKAVLASAPPLLVMELRGAVVTVRGAVRKTYRNVYLLRSPFVLASHVAVFFAVRAELEGRRRKAEIMVCDRHVYFLPHSLSLR